MGSQGDPTTTLRAWPSSAFLALWPPWTDEWPLWVSSGGQDVNGRPSPFEVVVCRRFNQQPAWILTLEEETVSEFRGSNCDPPMDIDIQYASPACSLTSTVRYLACRTSYYRHEVHVSVVLGSGR